MGQTASRLAIVVLPAVLLLPGAVQAADVEFHPEISIQGEYTDNVTVLPGSNGTSDVISRLQVLLPVVRKWDSGQFEFRYAPAYEWYQDTGYLDNDIHNFSFGLENNPGRKASVRFDAAYSKAVVQGGSESLIAGDLVMTSPADRERMNLATTYRRQVTRRWSWTGSLNAAGFRYDVLEDAGSAPVTEIEDRSEWGASFELNRSLSQQTDFGLLVNHSSYELDLSGSEDVERLAMVVNRNLGGPGDELRFELGVSDRSGDFLLPGSSAFTTLESTDFFGVVSLTRTLRKSRWTMNVSLQPSSGGVSAVPTTDTVAGVVYGFSPGPSWNGSVSGRYASQDPVDDAMETIDSLAFGFQIEWRPNRKFGYRLGADTVDQSGQAGFDDRSVTRGWLGLVWYPLGPQGSSGGRSG